MGHKHLCSLLAALALAGLAACGAPGAADASSGNVSHSSQGQEPTVLDRYQEVLLGQESFRCADGEAASSSLDISGVPALFDSNSEDAAISYFTVLDLDGDGKEEVVLQITDVSSQMGGYLILRCQDTDVLGYSSGWRTFWDLKTDGTFAYSQEGGTEDGIASVRFNETGFVMDKHIYGTGDWFIFDSFFIDGQQATKQEYDQALLKQDEKPDAQWYPFTQDNLQTVLTGSPS